MDKIDKRFDEINKRLDHISARVDKVETKVAPVVATHNISISKHRRVWQSGSLHVSSRQD